MVFSKTRINTGLSPSERPLPMEGTPPTDPGPHKQTIGLNPATSSVDTKAELKLFVEQSIDIMAEA